jgi:ABC-type cobalamin transport system permease subunit
VTLQRRLNGRVVPRPEEGPVPADRLQAVHVRLILLDFSRGVLLVGSGVAVARAALPALAQNWPLSLAHTVALLTTGAAVSMGALVRRQGERASTRVLLLAGVAGGLILAAVL